MGSLDSSALLAVAVAVALGALVQGAVGLGLGLVAAPVVTLAQPELMPGVMLWLAAVYPLVTLRGEWRHADWRGLGWAFAGRVPGTALGVAVVAAVSPRLLGVIVAVVVLVAVALTGAVVRLPMRPGVFLGAGVVSGVTGTATSIGGPPLALVYQDVEGTRLRATMAVYFLVGALMSLAGLGLAGELRASDLLLAALLSPVLLLGFALAGPLRRRLDAGWTRPAVLVLCSASSLALLVRSVLG